MLTTPRLLALCALVAACEATVSSDTPVFIEGRAVAPAGDSVFGVTASGGPLLLLRASGPADSLGADVLHDPVTAQFAGGQWWVSDFVNGQAEVVRFGPAGPTRVPLGADAAQPHQFAVLPDGGVVYEARDRRLAVRRGDSTALFAVVELGDRPSLTVGAGGGVLHAVPGRHLTLYNTFGNVRWRIEWPWVETAHIGALAIDGRARIHVLSGVADEGTFIVYTIEPGSGEVTRWSVPDSSATFVVNRLGEVTAAVGGRWRR